MLEYIILIEQNKIYETNTDGGAGSPPAINIESRFGNSARKATKVSGSIIFGFPSIPEILDNPVVVERIASKHNPATEKESLFSELKRIWEEFEKKRIRPESEENHGDSSDKLHEHPKDLLKKGADPPANTSISIYYPDDPSMSGDYVSAERDMGFEGNNGIYSELKKKASAVFSELIEVSTVYDYNIYSCMLPSDRFLVLVYDKDDNPLDYGTEFLDALICYYYPLIGTYNGGMIPSDKLENALLGIFLDMRLRSSLASGYIKDRIGISYERLEAISRNKIIKVFLYGIDNAGKSSFVRYLKTGRFDHNYFPATKKFVIHKLKFALEDYGETIRLVIWEMPGQKVFRRAWLRGVQDSNILIFMLDAADSERYAEAKRALWSIITRYEVRGVPLLVIANKIDLIDDESLLGRIEPYLNLTEIKDRKVGIKFMSLVTGEGIREVLDWIASTIEDELIEEENRIYGMNGTDQSNTEIDRAP